MPYRQPPPVEPDELARITEDLADQLADAKRSLMAVRLVLVVAACLIVIQTISNFCLVEMSRDKKVRVPAEREEPHVKGETVRDSRWSGSAER